MGIIIYFYNVMKSVVCSIHMYISVFTLLMLIFLKFVEKFFIFFQNYYLFKDYFSYNGSLPDW